MTAPNKVYEHGETVDIRIDGAIVRVHDEQGLLFEVPGETEWFKAPASAAVDRIIPAEGEPAPGEVWADGQGRTWFAHGMNKTGRVEMVCAEPGYDNLRWPVEVNRACGPLRRLFTPPAATDAAGD